MPRRLPPIGEMPVEDAQVVVGADHTLFVVQIPAEEVEGGFVDLFGLVEITEPEVDPAETVVGVGERSEEIVFLEKRVGALTRAKGLLVLRQLDERSGA